MQQRFPSTGEIQPVWAGGYFVKPRNTLDAKCKIIGSFKAKHGMSRPCALAARSPGLALTLEEELSSLTPAFNVTGVEGGKHC